MKILRQENIGLNDCKAAPRNANRMDGTRFAALQAAIARDGFLQPIVGRWLGDDCGLEIIDGHHRVEAVRSLNNTRDVNGPWPGLDALPTVLVECTDQEAARLAISLNKLRGELDLTEVGAIFTDLIDAGVDPALLVATGFSSDQVDDLINAATEEGATEMPTEMSAPAESKDDEAPKAWVLELPFGNKKEYDRCRRVLRRAAGKGEELSVGLLRLIDDEKEDA